MTRFFAYPRIYTSSHFISLKFGCDNTSVVESKYGSLSSLMETSRCSESEGADFGYTIMSSKVSFENLKDGKPLDRQRAANVRWRIFAVIKVLEIECDLILYNDDRI